jgi:hypothetical protein
MDDGPAPTSPAVQHQTNTNTNTNQPKGGVANLLDDLLGKKKFHFSLVCLFFGFYFSLLFVCCFFVVFFFGFNFFVCSIFLFMFTHFFSSYRRRSFTITYPNVECALNSISSNFVELTTRTRNASCRSICSSCMLSFCVLLLFYFIYCFIYFIFLFIYFYVIFLFYCIIILGRKYCF